MKKGEINGTNNSCQRRMQRSLGKRGETLTVVFSLQQHFEIDDIFKSLKKRQHIKLYKLMCCVSRDGFQQVCWNKQTNKKKTGKTQQVLFKITLLEQPTVQKKKKKNTLGIKRCSSWRSRGGEQQPDTKQRPVGL